MKSPIQIFRDLAVATSNIAANAFNADTEVEFYQALAQQAKERKAAQEQNARLLSGEGLLKTTDLYNAIRECGACERLSIHSTRSVNAALVEGGYMYETRIPNGYSYIITERAARLQLGKTQTSGQVSSVAWDPCMLDIILSKLSIDDLEVLTKTNTGTLPL